MLGWFKKKFKKKEAEAEAPLQEEPAAPVEAEEESQPQVIPEDTTPEEVSEEAIPEELVPEERDTGEKVTEEAAIHVAEEAAIHVPEPKPEPDEEPEHGIPSSDEEPVTAEIEPPAEDVAEEAETDELPPEVLPDEAPDEVEVKEETVAAEVAEPVEALAEVEPVMAEEEVEPSPAEPVEPGAPEASTVPESEAEPAKKQAEKKKKSLFTRLTDRLARTRESFTYQLDTLFLGKKEIDADLMDDLEELLITADLGVSTTEEILDHARRRVKRKELSDPNSLKQVIQDKIKSFIEDSQEDAELVMPDKGPFVIMVVGVNGVGKTTTIGKIANKFVQSGQSVLLVAADTFRAAAISQLKIWGERNNVPVASQDEGSDPSSVVFDAIAHARAKEYDVVLVDTAGRLHTQANLMEELKKIKRVMGKQLKGAPHEVLLVVDATTGQNGISQAKLFDAAVDITGIALTKLDGTAKGGIVANISRELKTPIRFIGIGETIDDLRDFDTDEFVQALFQNPTAENQESAV